MANQVVILEAAANDLAQGIDFYETQKAGLGAYFFDSLIADIESLEISAGVHAIRLGLHRMLSRRFPFAIYYNLQNNRAEVVAVLDMRSNPAWTREQLEKRQ
ncbi:MAG: hypothetical protein K9M54_05775 [Kiritimatiellales bacterium]|nr:hypothetical protein [Kiritimatiellales bacterium]